MKRSKSNLSILIAIIGTLVSLTGFAIDNVFAFGIGVIAILIYIAIYIKENIIDGIINNKRKINSLSKDINSQKEINEIKERLSYLEGKMSISKNKKGTINPITLVIIIIILMLLIIWLKNSGYI